MQLLRRHQQIATQHHEDFAVSMGKNALFSLATLPHLFRQKPGFPRHQNGGFAKHVASRSLFRRFRGGGPSVNPATMQRSMVQVGPPTSSGEIGWIHSRFWERWKVYIPWNYPPTQDASHHQDYSISSRESL